MNPSTPNVSNSTDTKTCDPSSQPDVKALQLLNELSVSAHAVDQLRIRHSQATEWDQNKCITFILKQAHRGKKIGKKRINSYWTCVVEDNQIVTIYWSR